MLPADSLDYSSFKDIIIVTGKGIHTVRSDADAPVLPRRNISSSPSCVDDDAGLELSEQVQGEQMNEGAFVITKKALEQRAKSDKYESFKSLLTNQRNRRKHIC